MLKVPPVRSQVNDIVYEIALWKENEKGDMDKRKRSYISRMMSYIIILDIIKEQPVFGVGAGDLGDATNTGYNVHYPYVPTEHRIIVHNQFLATMASIGIPLSILLILLSIVPLLYKTKHSIYLVLNYIVVFGFMYFEAILEIQYGVFIFLFFTLFWFRVLNSVQPQYPLFKELYQKLRMAFVNRSYINREAEKHIIIRNPS